MKIISAILLFLSFCSIVIVPFTIFELKDTSNSILNSSEYRKIKVLINDYYIRSKDSPGEGIGGGDKIILEVDQPKLNITIDDQNDALIGKKKTKFNKEKKVIKYLEAHNDSIWIWYSPKLKPKIANENSKTYNSDEDYNDLRIQLVTILLGVTIITLTFFYNKKLKKEKQTKKL